MAVKPDEALEDAYASWLDASSRIAFALSLIAFALYVGGVLPSFVPLDTLAGLWGLPVDAYLDKTAAPSGWSWLRLLGFADYLTLACMALIALVTVLCYLAILPRLLRHGERLQAALVLFQALVLLGAASGLVAGGR
jgi:hypothetical protein